MRLWGSFILLVCSSFSFGLDAFIPGIDFVLHLLSGNSGNWMP
jgi:hypothetical protein